MLNDNMCCDTMKSVPCSPQRSISDDIANINYGLCEIERVVETMLRKIDGGNESATNESAKEPSCISGLLETMKIKTERIYNKIDQVNSMI